MPPGGEDDRMADYPSDITILDDSDDESVWSVEETNKREKLIRIKNSYIQKIKNLCGRDDGFSTPLNIALIGSYGVGKSSLINTIAAAFSKERWREYAECGAYGGQAKAMSVYLDSFKKCCKDRYEEDDQYRDVLMPTLVDLAGFPDEDTEKWEELLRIVFYGRLQEGEALLSAYEYAEKHGVVGLREKYSREGISHKIDRVIFVGSLDEPVPKNLIKCMLKAAKPSGTGADRGKRAIPVFGVMTKADKIRSENRETAKAAEDEFIACLGLKGNRPRFLLCKNYCDDNDPEQTRTEMLNPEIDVPILKFMYQVVDCSRRVQHSQERYQGTLDVPEGQYETENRGRIPDPNWLNLPAWDHRRTLAFAIDVLLIAILVGFLSSPSVDQYQLSTDCARLARSDGYETYPVLESICNNRAQLGSWSWTSWLAFVFILIVKILTEIVLRQALPL